MTSGARQGRNGLGTGHRPATPPHQAQAAQSQDHRSDQPEPAGPAATAAGTVAAGCPAGNGRVVRVGIGIVGLAVPVRIGIVRVGPQGSLTAVAQAVAVGIPVGVVSQRVEAVVHLETVVDAVAIGVRHLRIGPRLNLGHIAEAVAIAVGLNRFTFALATAASYGPEATADAPANFT